MGRFRDRKCVCNRDAGSGCGSCKKEPGEKEMLEVKWCLSRALKEENYLVEREADEGKVL